MRTLAMVSARSSSTSVISRRSWCRPPWGRVTTWAVVMATSLLSVGERRPARRYLWCSRAAPEGMWQLSQSLASRASTQARCARPNATKANGDGHSITTPQSAHGAGSGPLRTVIITGPAQVDHPSGGHEGEDEEEHGGLLGP